MADACEFYEAKHVNTAAIDMHKGYHNPPCLIMFTNLFREYCLPQHLQEAQQAPTSRRDGDIRP